MDVRKTKSGQAEACPTGLIVRIGDNDNTKKKRMMKSKLVKNPSPAFLCALCVLCVKTLGVPQ
jgi:ferredoxin